MGMGGLVRIRVEQHVREDIELAAGWQEPKRLAAALPPPGSSGNS
jgi:hypothetical protein